MKIWTKVEPEPKINNFGSATLQKGFIQNTGMVSDVCLFTCAQPANDKMIKSNLGYLMSYALLNRGLWIWIRMDPYPGGENLKEKNRKNARKLV